MRKIAGIFLAVFMLSWMCIPVKAAAAGETMLYVGGHASGGMAFASLGQAKEYIRGINSNMTKDIIVNIASGEYPVAETICFSEEDSATNGHKIIYRGVGTTPAVISGGKRITGWRVHDKAKNIYAASAQGIDARAFFVNDICAVRARSADWFLNDQMSFTEDKSGFVTTYTDIANWKNQTEIELVFSNFWAMPRVFVNSITLDNGKAYIKPNGLMAKINSFNFATAIKTNPLYIENAYELLDEKGEFYIDKSADTIYYIPRDGEDMQTVSAVLPTVESVIDIKSKSADSKVNGIVFENLSFKHSDWKFVSRTRGIYDRQANIPMRWFADNFTTGEFTNPGLVNVQYAENCKFEGCEFSLSAAAGLKYSNGVQNSPIVGNYVHDVYASGISVGEVNESSYFSAPGDKQEYTLGNHILNNYVTRVSKVYEGSCGIFLGYIQDTQIEHNEVSDVPYSAFSTGWGWAAWASNSKYANDTQGTVLRNISIKKNYIHDIGNGSMVDGGAIYMLGASGGSLSAMNECSENYIRNIGKLATALYPDEGSTYWFFEKNVIDVDADAIGGYDMNVRWIHLHQPSIYNIRFLNNYTTTENDQVDSTATVIEDTHYILDRQWPPEALSVIKNAGLEEQYSKRIGQYEGFRHAASLIECASDWDVGVGESTAIELSVFNDYCEKIDGAQISYEVLNPQFAKIESGVIYGIQQGKTDVVILAEKDGFQAKKTISVYVGDEVCEADFENRDNSFVVGDGPNFKVTAKTALGKALTDPAVRYSVSDPAIMQVDENGKANIAGEGKCTLYADVDYLGRTKRFEKSICVSLTNNFDLANHNVVCLGSIFNDLPGWNVEWVKEKRGDKSIAFQTQGGYAIYAGRKYGNEVLDFDFTIEADGGWPTILLRAQSMNVNPLSGNTAYFIGLKSDCVELQMFKNSQRYLYYGTLDGYDAIAGEAVKNTFYKYRDRNNIKVAALNEENGVRIIVIINGMQVMNYLDTTENAITQRGYFGAICYDGQIVLDEASGKVSAPIEEEAYTDLDLALEKEYITAQEAADVMANGGAVCKEEFIAFLMRIPKLGGGAPFREYPGMVLEGRYKNSVLSAMELGIVDRNLLAADSFWGNNRITREEGASLLINALKYAGAAVSDGDIAVFADCFDISGWARDYMRNAVGIGLFRGDGNALLRPREFITLEETAALLVRAANLIEK